MATGRHLGNMPTVLSMSPASVNLTLSHLLICLRQTQATKVTCSGQATNVTLPWPSPSLVTPHPLLGAHFSNANKPGVPTPTTSFMGLSNSRPGLSPQHQVSTSKTSPYAPESTDIIQMSQSSGCLPCLIHFSMEATMVAHARVPPPSLHLLTSPGASPWGP